ncbi:hypothetical protein D3C71_2123360 [compost metagenome]
MTMVLSFTTRWCSWFCSSSSSTASSIGTSRTKMVAFRSGRTSLSKMKFSPEVCASTSKMTLRLASRNSRVTGRSRRERSCG